MRRCSLLLVAGVAVAAAASGPLHAAGKSQHYPLEYRVALQPESDSAKVTLTLEKTALVRVIDFNVGSGLYSDFASDSPWRQEGDRLFWEPEGERARLSGPPSTTSCVRSCRVARSAGTICGRLPGR
jgi:hypothetical protein